jgi:hypothetical protein
VVVWGTGNTGATAIRSATAFPGLELAGVITASPEKAGRDAATFAGLAADTGVTATLDVDAALANCDAVAYMASGDLRPDEAIADVERCLRAGAHVVTPSLYSHHLLPGDLRLLDLRPAACGTGELRVRRGNIRLIGRSLGLVIDEITEVVERLPLAETCDNAMGRFEKGTQGAFWLKVIGWSGSRQRIVVEHVTRIHPDCAPHWPHPDDAHLGGAGDHRVIVDGDPRLTITSRADVPGGTRADGGNTTAANRLLGAIEWLAAQQPGIYDGLDVPLHTPLADAVEATRWAD